MIQQSISTRYDTFQKVCEKFVLWLPLMLMLLFGTQLSVAVHAQNSNGDPIPYDENRNPRKPILVLQTSRVNYLIQGPTNWGHETDYGLEVVDNQNPQGLYGLGCPQEAFSNIQQGTNPPGIVHNPGHADTWPQGATLTDQNSSTIGVNPANYGETLDTLWYSFDQTWHDVQTPTGDYTLNVHHIAHFYGYAMRTY